MSEAGPRECETCCVNEAGPRECETCCVSEACPTEVRQVLESVRLAVYG